MKEKAMREHIEQIVWRHVDDAMPAEEDAVLICGPQWNPTQGWYEDGHWYWMDGWDITVEITHWAELPKGPLE